MRNGQTEDWHGLKMKPRYFPGEVVYLKEPYSAIDGGIAGTLTFYRYNGSNDIMDRNLRWKNKMFMPADKARFFIRITKVRCERLQDITEEDAIAEGIEKVCDYGTTGYKLYTQPDAAFSDIDAVWSYESLWESINGKGSWDLNPWIWIYEFQLEARP